MAAKNSQDQFENMQFAYSRERADKIIEEYEIITLTKFNKLYYHKYDTAKSKIRWERRNGLPYVILQSTKYECEHGKNRDIVRNERKRKTEARKRYNTVLPSKKRDCRATIKLLEVMMFPQFKVPNTDRRETVTASQRLREALSSTVDGLQQEYRCYIKFPQQSEHSGHVVEQPIDYLSMDAHDILPAISGLVADGRCSIDVLKSALTNHWGEPKSEQKDLDLKVMEDILSSSLLEASQNDHHQYVTMDDDTYEMYDPQMGVFVKGNFGNEDTFPSCTCFEFKRSLVPCKHAMTVIRNSQNGLDIYPSWYLKLLQICAPRASESQRRETEAAATKANSYLNRFMQQVQDGRLTLEELKVMNIGFASIKDQLPGFTPDDDKFPRAALQTAVSLKPRRAYITPGISNRSPRLSQDLITNGTHALSLLKLKTLERELRGKEREKIKGVDKDFREGFLHEDIVNSYFFTLCQTDTRCVYVPTDVLFMLATGHQLNDREVLPTVGDKRFMFLPWMSTHTQPMVLLIVDMLTKQLVYLHPLREVDVQEETVNLANEFVQTKIRSFFDFEINQVVSVSRVYHEKHDLPAPVRNGQDGGFISILICLYAKWYTEDPMSLDSVVGSDMHVFREHIYDTIVGGCLDSNGSRDHCRKCTSTDDQGERIQCCRCSQWYHMACISPDLGEVYPTVFVCPTGNHVDPPPTVTDWSDEVVQYMTEGHGTADRISQC